MSTQPTNLFRSDFSELVDYQPASWIDPSSSRVIKLNSGENPYVNSKFAYYPDPLCSRLRAKLAIYTQTPATGIVCGNGSDELIDLVIRLFINPGDEIIISPPTFAMYEVFGRLNQAKVISVPRQPDLRIDLNGLLAQLSSKTKLIFIDSPGNPSGTTLVPSELKRLLEQRVIVCVDEAYFEYCGQTTVPLLSKYRNLIILRTFSKWAGLASLRLGYALTSPTIASALMTIKPPYNVNGLAQQQAIKSLTNIKKIRSKLQTLVALRQQSTQRLSQIPGFKVFPSQSAYIVFSSSIPASDLQTALATKNILLKRLTSPPFTNCLRLNLGKPSDIRLALSEIARICQPTSLIFDIDDTLVDVSRSYREAIRLTAQDFLKRPVTPQEVAAIKSQPGMNNDWDATFALISPVPNPQLYTQVKRRFQKYYLGTKIQPGLVETEKLLIRQAVLERLSRNYQLAIVTGRPRTEAKFVLAKFKIQKYFSPIICLEDTPQGKPAPDPILLCLKRLSTNQAIYIGDSINDALSASAAQIPNILVGSPNLRNSRLANINFLPKMLKSVYT